MSVLFRLLALLICGLVAIQLVLFIARSLSHFIDELALRRLRIEKLRDDIALLRAKCEKQRQAVSGWNGLRKFRVAKKTQESVLCHSFYLVPHDGKPLPAFLPGQYLTFQLRIPGQKKPIVRCYSLSDRHDERYYRCTIKKMLPPSSAPHAAAGLSSVYFNEVIEEGDILDVKAPRGQFYLHQDRDTPVVLLAGGVGITPLMSMARTLLATGSPRPIYMFAGFPNSEHHLFRVESQTMAGECPAFDLTVCYSEPLAADVLGRDFQVKGRIDISLVQARLNSTNADFYLCGPGPFMVSLTEGLVAWGVPDERIHTEAFGPSSVKKRNKMAVGVPVGAGVGLSGTYDDPVPSVDPTVNVRFDRSDQQLPWDDSHESLLEFAEAQGIEIESGCRAGSCGTCLTAVKSGKVRYAEGTDAACEDGTCLPCIGIPDGSVTLDA